MRIIPSVMLSQHPDHAQKPFWHNQALIKTHDEIKECYLMFKELGADEVMWDWEGKLVDEAVIERLLGSHTDFFKKKPIGEKIFLTFRVPNPRVEPGYRLARSFMVILSGQFLANIAGYKSSPLFEVILPLTETAKEMIEVQKSFSRFVKATNLSFATRSFPNKTLEIIPIFESVETILRSGEIIRKYAKAYERQFKQRLPYLRPFCARSDPALNSGIVPTTLAIKWALSEYAEFSRQTGIPTYPVIAPGALPFRGGLTPETVLEFMDEFAGVRTLVIQSAFRYDYPMLKVKPAIKRISRNLPQSKIRILANEYFAQIQTIIPWFEKPYKSTVESMSVLINQVANYIPQRRERVQHIGLFGYSRQMGKAKLPRAIGFTASCYSLGLPPELIGTGRGVQKAKREGKLKLVEELYRQLKPALLTSGRYLRKASLSELKIAEVADDIETIEEYLGEKLGPKTKDELTHSDLVGKIITKLEKGLNPKEEIEQAAILRHSLG